MAPRPKDLKKIGAFLAVCAVALVLFLVGVAYVVGTLLNLASQAPACSQIENTAGQAIPATNRETP